MNVVTFPYLSMCWNACDVQPFSFNNTMRVEEDHPVDHLLAWTAVVARGAPSSKLKALVINCHGRYNWDPSGATDSAGGIPRIAGGFGLKIGTKFNADNADLFRALSGLVEEIHLYACGSATSPDRLSFPDSPAGDKMCQLIADTSKAVLFASKDFQPDVLGPGLNQAPEMIGQIRFVPRLP